MRPRSGLDGQTGSCWRCSGGLGGRRGQGRRARQVRMEIREERERERDVTALKPQMKPSDTHTHTHTDTQTRRHDDAQWRGGAGTHRPPALVSFFLVLPLSGSTKVCARRPHTLTPSTSCLHQIWRLAASAAIAASTSATSSADPKKIGHRSWMPPGWMSRMAWDPLTARPPARSRTYAIG